MTYAVTLHLPETLYEHFRQRAEWSHRSLEAETLTPREHAELIALSDQMEEMNAQRMGRVIQLASLRQMTVDALMEELGIKSPLYE